MNIRCVGRVGSVPVVLAKRQEQSLEDLFEERLVLYRKYADITIACAGLSQEEVCTQIIERATGPH